FEALARLLQALAARAPLLIFLDDLQWIDHASLDLFQYLGRQWAEHATPIMLLLSRRTETRSMDPWLVEWFTNLKRDIPLTRLELGPLSANAILQIARFVAGQSGELQAGQRTRPAIEVSLSSLHASSSEASIERFGTWLFAETKGQPFFVRA